MDFVEIFHGLLDSPNIILLFLMGVDLLLCQAVTMSKNAITCYNLCSRVKWSIRSSFVIIDAIFNYKKESTSFQRVRNVQVRYCEAIFSTHSDWKLIVRTKIREKDTDSWNGFCADHPEVQSSRPRLLEII